MKLIYLNKIIMYGKIVDNIKIQFRNIISELSSDTS